jgi:hypothetical protein
LEKKKSASDNKNQKNNAKKTDGVNKVAQSKSKETEITDWFYMTPYEVTAKMIATLLKTQCNVSVDLWEEMNILQIELPNRIIVDFEPIIINFKDPSDAAFVKNRNIQTIFEVTMEEAALKEMKEVLKLIFNEWDGFLCADTDDFKPIYGKTEI